MITWINAHPRAYIGACLFLGFVGRAWLAHGDLTLWLNPLFPLFVR